MTNPSKDESSGHPTDGSTTDLPRTATPPLATIRSREEHGWRGLKTNFWWGVIPCLLVAAVLVASHFWQQGITIHVRFKNGHGLKAGDKLQYRGIECGTVTGVNLANDMDAVNVGIEIYPGNESIAVEGSQFWIQRPRLGLGQVSGLDTVVGAKYVGVLPGRSDRGQRSFEGIETPLALTEGDSVDVRVRFAKGDGLNVGHAVRYRGVQVGEVTAIDLDADLQAIAVVVRLVGTARQLAREGTQFWIEYPRLELTEIRGLDTLVGGTYMALEPGPADAQPLYEFVGQTQPPPLPRRSGSLEIELDAPSRMGVVRGAPILYRGLEVGKVANVGLSLDGASVKVTAIVDTEYVELVREDSKWWVVGGVRFNAGLGGFEISIDSFSSWMRGGIAFATPPSPGKHVVTGHRFMLEPKPQDDWLKWQPRIAIGTSNKLESGLPYPTVHRVVASWSTSILGIRRRHSEECWGVALSNGKLVLPMTLVHAASESGENVAIEIAGFSFPFDSSKLNRRGEIAQLNLPSDASMDGWPIERIQTAKAGSTTLLILNPELTEPIALDATRVQRMPDGGLKVANGIPLSNHLNGSPVIDSASGQVVGLLSHTKSGWIVGEIVL